VADKLRNVAGWAQDRPDQDVAQAKIRQA
jgi:hypothetical protein